MIKAIALGILTLVFSLGITAAVHAQTVSTTVSPTTVTPSPTKAASTTAPGAPNTGFGY